jgi:hypothetical protein
MFNKIKGLFKPKLQKTKIQFNRDRHKELMQVWDSTKSISGGAPIALMESYYDKNGNIYYIHKNITDLHISRQFEFNKAMQGIEWGVTTPVLKGRLKQIEEALNSEDAVVKTRGKKAVSDLQLRMERIPEKRMFLELAMALIYRHDENPYIYETAMRARKLQDIASDPNLESFFLSEAWGVSKSYLNPDRLEDYKIQYFPDFQAYLMEREVEKILKSTG